METKRVPALRFPGFEGEWEAKRLRDVGSFFSGGTPTTSKKEYFGGNIPFIRSGEIHESITEQFISEFGLKNSSAKLVEKGDILYALYGATSGEVSISKIKGAINQAILCIRGDFDKLFTVNALRKEKENILKTFLQGGQGNLSAEIIKSLLVTFPPLPEQRKIASFLTAVDDRIRLLKKKKTLLETYKKGMMQKLFSQEVRFTDADGKDFPEWEEKKLGEVGKIIRGASPRPKGDPRYYGGTVPRLMVQDVSRDGKYVTPRIDYLTETGRDLSRPCKAGTLTIVCSGTVGIPSILAIDACIHDGFLAIVDIDMRYSIDFIYHNLTTLRDKFESSATHGGVFTNLTTGILKDFVIKIPALPEQTRIASFLTSLDGKINVVQQQIEGAQEWKKGLLQKLFV